MALLIETRLNSLKLSESTHTRKGCLGRLEGICADFKNPTRNGRLYKKELWENVFNDPIFQESIKSKTLLGELDHPEDRLEVLAGEACIVMTDYRIDEAEGVVYGGFDILDTPRGKILKSLLDYGCVMGVSSRGQGDITNTSEGEVVDADTYDFACFDVVTTPAVEKARQNVVESVTKKKNFIDSIKEQIKEAETIGDLNAIRKVVEATQVSNMDSLLESIKDKCNLIKEGKTITSENKELHEKVEQIVNDETTDENTVQEDNVDSANTIREQKELLSCINNMRKQISAYKHRENRLLQIVQSKNTSIEQLQRDIKDCKTSQKYTNSMLRCENKSLTGQIESLSTKLTNTEDKLIEATKKLQNTEEQLDVVNEHLHATAKKVKMTKDVAKNQINELTDNNNQMLFDMKQKQSRVEERFKKILSDKDNEIAKLTESVKSNKKNLTSCNQKYENLNEEYSNLNKEYSNLDKKHTKLAKEYSSLNKCYDELNECYNALTNDYNGLDSESKNIISKLNNEVSKLKKSMSQKDNRLAELQENLIKKDKTVTRLQNSIASKDEKLANLQETLSTKETKLNNEHNTVKSLENEVTGLNETLLSLQNQISELNKQIETLESESYMNQAESDNVTNEMESEINSYTELVDSLQEQVNNLKNQREESIKKNRQLTKKCNQLLERLSTYQHSYVSTKSKQLGIDPNSVEKFVTADTTISQVNKIVEDLQKTKDRYAKLPITESSPKSVQLDNIDIKPTKDNELDRLTSFIEKVANVK